MSITKSQFGKTKDGKTATLYTLTNRNKMSVSFTDYGANIVSILVPDKNGVLADVALGFDTVTGYENNGPGFGSFIGRVGNRIENAVFTLNDVTYQLEKNSGSHCLHGGFIGYNKHFYETEYFEEDEGLTIEFSRLSPDMEQGFPGNLDITVSYTLTEENELLIEYFAVSDKDTLFNPTNHSYFNLAGQNAGSILDHMLFIDAIAYTATDAGLIPTGELTDVSGTPMDFRTAKTIGQDIGADYEPLKVAGGYDHNYVLNTTREEASLVAKLWDPKSGRCMEVFTDLPGMQLYTGNFLDGVLKGKKGAAYSKQSGVCFESQFYPNSCNIKSFPDSTLPRGKEFESVTIYKFTIQK